MLADILFLTLCKIVIIIIIMYFIRKEILVIFSNPPLEHNSSAGKDEHYQMFCLSKPSTTLTLLLRDAVTVESEANTEAMGVLEKLDLECSKNANEFSSAMGEAMYML